MPTNVRDPRTIITPDAFEISRDLLGTPLAPPWRRFWALMIDLAAIGLLTAMFDDIALFVWGAVALILLRLAFRRTPATGPQAMSVMSRTAVGCLGVVILVGIGIAVLATVFSGGGAGPGVARLGQVDFDDDDEGGAVTLDGGRAARAVMAAMGGRRRLAEAETEEEAVTAAASILRSLADVDMPDEARVQLLQELTPDDAAWAGEETAVYEQALAAWRAGAGADEATMDAEDPAVAEEEDPAVDSLSDGEALAAYAALLYEGADLGSAGARALRRRTAGLVAEDTLGALSERLLATHDSMASEQERRRDAEEELQASGNAFVDLLRDVWDQLGSAIGLWSLYFTVLLTLWRGQTVGKRLLGLRVLRLDGQPMNWWSAFERGGGYVAGLATGLLGFAQVFWDPNRQCIHDKIVGTVVVDDRAPRVPGAWQEAWSGGTEEECA